MRWTGRLRGRLRPPSLPDETIPGVGKGLSVRIMTLCGGPLCNAIEVNSVRRVYNVGLGTLLRVGNP